MIDTDKYEGHSEGEWYWSPDGLRCKTHLVYPSHRNILWNGTPPHPPKDMKLIADAPLLLAEVKRLRSDMAYCASLITCMIDMGDPLSLFVVREGMLDSIGMTVDEAMATTDLMGDEEE